MSTNKTFIYLASPYSHKHSHVRERRYIQACINAAHLMEQGKLVFSPIAHSHPIEEYGMDTVKDGPFWLEQDYAILKHVDELVVLMLDGWKESQGIAKELEFAKENNIPVAYMEPVMWTEHYDNGRS